MPQGGFGRDYQQVTLLQNRAAEKKLQIEREKIGEEVFQKLEPRAVEYLEKSMDMAKKELTEAYEEPLREMREAIKAKDKTLWFLIRISYFCMVVASGLLGYLTAGLF
jgi:hypothetical protein